MQFIARNKSYIPIILFSLLLISPLIVTGLPLKKYTRLNEIFLIVTVMICFMYNAFRGKPIGLKRIEQLVLLIGFSLIFSTLYGYLFLDIIISPLDFYPVFNIILFVFYFRCGTYFNYKNINRRRIQTIFFTSFMIYNFISISMLFPWGIENVMPTYLPEHAMNRYQEFFRANLFLSRISGILGNANSSAIITVILIIMIISWKMYLPAQGFKYSILINILLFSSLLCLLLSFSRSAIISLIVAYIYLLVSPNLSRSIRKTRMVLLIILFGSIVFFTIRQTDQLFGIPFSNLRNYSFYDAPGESGLKGRFTRWELGMEKYIFSPVFGTGTANATNILNEKLGVNTVKSFYSPHNEYINILLVTGLLGLFLYLLLFITVFKKASIILKNNTDDFSVFIARSIKAIIIALAVFNMAVGFWDNSYIPPMLMLLFGAMYAADSTSSRILSNYTLRSLK